MHLEVEINSIEPIATSSVKSENRQISYLATTALNPDPRNPRLHTREQIRSIAKSIEAFGFNAPILVDANRKIVAGHGRHEAAKDLGLTQVPVIFLDHLTETQARAYMLADNKLTDRSSWDDRLVATQLKELSELVLDFEIEATGFDPPEIDFRIQSLDSPDAADQADQFKPAIGPAVTVGGDLWLLGSHRLYCGDALSPEAVGALMGSDKAAATFMDPPYNVKLMETQRGMGGRVIANLRWLLEKCPKSSLPLS